MSKAEVEKLVDDAKDLVFILTNVYTCNYTKHLQNSSHTMVGTRTRSMGISRPTEIGCMLVLRHLVMSNRATFKSLKKFML